jgi:hypothetical protein
MNRKICIHSVLSLALLLGAGTARAQRHGPEGAAPFGEPMELMGLEGVKPGQVVKGAPFTGSISSETTQTLQDGTLIHRTSQGTVYRDSLGRSRKEMTVSGFGPLAASGGTHTMVSIADPVAGAHYMLDTTNKVAHKTTFHQHTGGGSANAESIEERIQSRLQKEIAAGLLKTEPLGTQVVNGVSAEGTRFTRTIPAGQIGNDKPISIVSERWYSPDLQIVVKSTRTDPQFGTTTYTVSNIQRTEPAATLFEVPAEYTVQAGGSRGAGGRRSGAVGAFPPAAADQD